MLLGTSFRTIEMKCHVMLRDPPLAQKVTFLIIQVKYHLAREICSLVEPVSFGCTTG
jgi:hypothetical protein